MRIVTLDEFADRLAHRRKILEDAAMDRLLLEGAVEAFRHPVGLRLGNERRAGGAPQNFTWLRK